MSGCNKKHSKETSSGSVVDSNLGTSTMYAPIPCPATPSQSCPPGPTQGTSKGTPTQGTSKGTPTRGTSKGTLTPPAHQPGPFGDAKKLTECLEQHFDENCTQVKAAIYHLGKNQSKEGAQILEKVLRLNAMRQKQMAYQVQNMTPKIAALEQKADSLKKRERFLMNSQVKMQQNMEKFALAFDDDMEEMEEPEQKKARKGFLTVNKTKMTDLHL